jgi:sugar/nucleoside kinase (ribokinase family)
LLFDYLVIGHATRDVEGSTVRVGGTVAYAAQTARALGCRAAVITSAGANLELSESLGDVTITRLLAPASTTFENTYTRDGRQQVIRGVADPLGPEAIPHNWRAHLMHVGPVARECDPALMTVIEGAFVGVTPQGWMRQWDDAGRVSRRAWNEARLVLPHADAVVLSEEDVGSDGAVVTEYARETRCLALTRGAEGCTVYADGEVRQFPAPSVDEVDPTGAGDIFAACLFYALEQGYDPWAAARFANCIAARSVTRPGLLGAPLEAEIACCRRGTLTRERDDAHHLRAG